MKENSKKKNREKSFFLQKLNSFLFVNMFKQSNNNNKKKKLVE